MSRPMKYLWHNLYILYLFILFICHVVQGQELRSAEKKEIINTIGKLLNENYVFPEQAMQCVEFLNRQYSSGSYNRITHPRKLAEALTRDLRSLTNDKHLRVQEQTSEQKKIVKTDPLLAQLLSIRDKAIDNYGFREAKILEGNIGYLKINTFEPLDLAKVKVASTLHFLENTDALIFDLRENTGGNPTMVQYICSHFFKHPTHLNSFYWRRGDYIEDFWTLEKVAGKKRLDVPVFILTSSITFSAGEEFVYNFKTRKRAQLIGTKTAGGANPGHTFTINDRFRVFIPTGRAINPVTEVNWEGIGIEPDIEIPAADALPLAFEKAKQAARNFRNQLEEKAVHNLVSLTNNLKLAAALFYEKKSGAADSLVSVALNHCIDLQLIEEWTINLVGYRYMAANDLSMAISVLRFNTKKYSESTNAYDSLAEAYFKSGDKDSAINNYKISLDLDPNNQNAKHWLKKLIIE
jgi:tetratricopeptide (TPR) repeat protein